MPRLISATLLLAAVFAAPLAAQQSSCPAPCAQDGPIYIALYWKARPGMDAEYERYIREVAQPIDDEAERAGAFEELRTYVPDQPNGEWTHLRVFRLKDQAQLDAFSARMDEAGKRIYPDPSVRPKSEHLRDLVRREVWRAIHSR